MKLTKSKIDGFQYQGTDNARDVRWDDEVPGFGVRVYPSGKKSFVLSYRHEGRKRMMALGAYGVLTLEQARKRARDHLVNLDKVDPLAQKQQATQGATLAALCAAYLKRHATGKKTGLEDERRINRHILPRWKNHKVTAIKRQDVSKLHHDLATQVSERTGKPTPYEANRTVALLRKMFNLATEWGFLPEDATNPANKVTMAKEVKRDRFLTKAELPRVFASIHQEENAYIRAAFVLYLLTGCRKSELLKARWDDVDWDNRRLKLLNTKNGTNHYIPLSAQAMTILQGLERKPSNPYILPGHVTGHPLVNLTKPWNRILKRAEVEGVRIHDLRRTVGSWMAQSGNPLHLIGMVLNHKNVSTTAIYAHFQHDHVEAALDAHGEHLMKIANGETATVVPIKSGAK